MKRNNRLAVWIAALCSMMSVTQAQNTFNVPFSQYGIGESSLPYNMPYISSMGGISFTRSSSNSINPFNPASYAAIETESFVFDMGVNIQMCALRNSKQRVNDADGTVGYVAVAFPLTHWWKTSIGIMPYSDVEYSSVQTISNPATFGTMHTIYDGAGEVSQIYWGHAFNLGKRLSLGFNANYLYGNISRGITYEFDGNDSTYYVNSRRQKETTVSNFLFDFGLQYRQPLSEKYSINLGLVYKMNQHMSLQDKALVYTFLKNAGSEYLLDTVFPARGQSAEYKSTLESPQSLGLGIAFERNGLWQVALDASYSPWHGMKYTEDTASSIFGVSAISYVPHTHVALGGEWKGNPDANSYWGRIAIRGGVHYDKGRLGLTLQGNDYMLDQKGVSMGFGFPMRKGKSMLNLSFSYITFGTDELLRRDCFTIGLSIGSCERWFVKRKYN